MATCEHEGSSTPNSANHYFSRSVPFLENFHCSRQPHTLVVVLILWRTMNAGHLIVAIWFCLENIQFYIAFSVRIGQYLPFNIVVVCVRVRCCYILIFSKLLSIWNRFFKSLFLRVTRSLRRPPFICLFIHHSFVSFFVIGNSVTLLYCNKAASSLINNPTICARAHTNARTMWVYSFHQTLYGTKYTHTTFLYQFTRWFRRVDYRYYLTNHSQFQGAQDRLCVTARKEFKYLHTHTYALLVQPTSTEQYLFFSRPDRIAKVLLIVRANKILHSPLYWISS